MTLLSAACAEGTIEGGDEPTAEASNVVAYELRKHIPHCDHSRVGQVFYVRAEDSFLFCDGKDLRRIDFRKDAKPGSLIKLVDADKHDCEAGGVLILVGRDKNKNGRLDDFEIEDRAAVCHGVGPKGTEPICDNGKDDDHDGDIDCRDMDCDSRGFCEFFKERTCNDNRDNDADGSVDCLDGDCAADENCQNCTAPVTVSLEPNRSPSAGYVPLSTFGIAEIVIGDEEIVNVTTDPFVYGGATYNSIGIVSNGYLVVGGGGIDDLEFINQSLPDEERPNNVLAPFWTDLDPSAGLGGVRASPFFQLGTDERWFVVDWENVQDAATTNTASFQVWIGLNGVQEIFYNYGEITGNRGTELLTVGAENSCGTEGVNYYYNGEGTLPVEGDELQIGPMTGETRCANAIDDDQDGLLDCNDPDCDGRAFCEPGTELTCDDALDNDSDGLEDCADPDCATTPVCCGSTVSIANVPGGSPAGFVSLALFGIAPTPLADEAALNLNVPEFLYNGETYTQVGLVSNGYVVVGGAQAADVEFLNQSLPDPALPNNVLAPFWTDLNPALGGAIRTTVLTDGTDSWVVLEWEDIPHMVTGETASFQVWIGINGVQDISFVYDAISGDDQGAALTVGAENDCATSGAMFFFNDTGTFPGAATELVVSTP